MIDTKFFFYNLDASTVNPSKWWSPVGLHDAGFIAQHGEGWVPIQHTFIPRVDGNFTVSIMCTKEIPTDVNADELLNG